MELYLPPIFKRKRPARLKINWTEEMIQLLCLKFPYTFNRELAKELGISMTAMHVKARKIGLKKQDGFLEINRPKIILMATQKLPPHPFKGKKGWSVPNSESTRFRPGQISIMKTDRKVAEKSRNSRNETIRRERIRIKACLPQKTKLKLL